MAKTQTNRRISSSTGVMEPHKYNVVFHNDDVTPMNFVVQLIHTVFRRSMEESEALMMKVHTEGTAVVGTYSLDIAASKAGKAMHIARSENYPLSITVEPIH